MEFFKKKCGYCREKIEKGKEVRREMKVPGGIGTSQKNFCSGKHASSYEGEMKACLKKQEKRGSGCCGSG